jgi:PAS domain S-box-containing protein
MTHTWMPSVSTLPNVELWTIRLLCILGGLAVPLSAVLIGEPGATIADSLAIRIALSMVALALFVATFTVERVRAEAAGLAAVLVHVYLAWFVAVAWSSGISHAHTAGAICLVIGAGLVAGSLRGPTWKGALTLVAPSVALLATAAISEGPETVRTAFAIAVVIATAAMAIGEWLRTRLRSHLASTNARLESVFDQVADGILLVDANRLAILASNPAFRQITGFDEQTLRSSTLYDLVQARPDEIDRDVQQAVENERAESDERRYKRKDGTPFAAHVTTAVVPDPLRRLLCVTVKDLSDQREARAQIAIARDQAQAMNELRTIFLNNMSHELRTPLVSLTGFLDLLQDEQSALDPGDRNAMIRSLRRSAERLNHTLNAVLDLAQIEGGHVDLRPELVEANRAAREAMNLLAPFAREKGLRLTFKECEHADVLIDRSALHRILLNLLSNAVKFTPAGEIGMQVSADSHRVMIHIRDTGIGIEPEFVPHLFGAFRQASAGHGREHEGCGLGLTITKRLMDLTGGRLRVDSTPGKGTHVTVLLARAYAPGTAALAGGDGAPAYLPADVAIPTAAVSVAPLAAHARALVVEDNADTARLMERMLSDVFEVEVASDAMAALQLARASWFDILLVDINLGPGMDGTTLLAKLRRMSAYAHVPAVAVTTYTNIGDRERFLAMGFDSYLPKPFTRKQLLATAQTAYASRALAAA